MSDIQEIADAIAEINGDIFELSPRILYKYKLELKSNGGTHLVYFLGNIIHNSEDDEREWNNEKYDYCITIEEYLRSAVQISLQAVEHINNIGSK